MYVVYVVVGMVLTTSAVMACNRCHFYEGGEAIRLVREEACGCPCKQKWRDSWGFCKRCDHLVIEKADQWPKTGYHREA